jgi:hypothetical protein
MSLSQSHIIFICYTWLAAESTYWIVATKFVHLSAEYTGVKNPGLFWHLVFGGTSGVSGQLVTYPLDVVRRRMQTSGMQQN